jgi:hypothetical protein
LKAWAPWHGQDGDFFEEKASSKITRLYHNVQPLARAGTASRLISDGIGPVKVSEALVSVKEKFFLRRKGGFLQGQIF